jgi:hypothetical protein
MEHRWGERVAVQTPVELFFGSSAAVQGLLENVSSSGGFIRIEGTAPPRGPVQVRLTALATSRRRTARIAGYIVRETADGVGVEWRQFAPAPVRELMSRDAPRTRVVKHKVRVAAAARRSGASAGLTHTVLTVVARESHPSDCGRLTRRGE